MKDLHTGSIAACLVCLGGLLTPSSVAHVEELPGPVVGAYVDLQGGRLQLFDQSVSVVSPLADSNGDGFFEAVLKVNLDPLSGYTRVNVLLEYEGAPSGWTLNLGDSSTNNGGGGDAATQQRDAEMQIKDGVLSVFASDVGGTPAASRIARGRLDLADGGFRASVSDMFLGWGAPSAELDFTTVPPGAAILYALNGQPDNEGPVNYDLHVGLNRVIWAAVGSGRIGAGLARVVITLE